MSSPQFTREAEFYLGLLQLKIPFTEDQLKQAYKAAAKKWHPDLNHSPDATESFKKIQEAKRYLDTHFDAINKIQVKSNFEFQEIKIYRKFDIIPKEVFLPKEIFITGGIVFMMIGSSEFKVKIPKTSTNVAQLDFVVGKTSSKILFKAFIQESSN